MSAFRRHSPATSWSTPTALLHQLCATKYLVEVVFEKGAVMVKAKAEMISNDQLRLDTGETLTAGLFVNAAGNRRPVFFK